MAVSRASIYTRVSSLRQLKGADLRPGRSSQRKPPDSDTLQYSRPDRPPQFLIDYAAKVAYEKCRQLPPASLDDGMALRPRRASASPGHPLCEGDTP